MLLNSRQRCGAVITLSHFVSFSRKDFIRLSDLLNVSDLLFREPFAFFFFDLSPFRIILSFADDFSSGASYWHMYLSLLHFYPLFECTPVS